MEINNLEHLEIINENIFREINLENDEHVSRSQKLSKYMLNSDVSQVNENIFAVLSQKLPKKYKPVFVVIVMAICHLLVSLHPIILRYYGSGNKIYVPFLCLFRCSIPCILIITAARFFEGKLNKFPTFKENVLLGLFGLLYVGMHATILNIIPIYVGANHSLIYDQIISLGVSFGSYFFKLEPYPSIRNTGSILILIGIFISSVSSITVISISFFKTKNESNIKINVCVEILIIALINLIQMSFFQNYQIKKFTGNEDSVLYNKPLTTLGLASLNSMMILLVGFSVPCIVNFSEIRPNLNKKGLWISIIYGTMITPFIGSSCLALCSVLVSPLFVSNTSPIKLLFGFILSYIIIGENFTLTQYIFCGIIFIGLIFLICGKIISKQNEEIKN